MSVVSVHGNSFEIGLSPEDPHLLDQTLGEALGTVATRSLTTVDCGDSRTIRGEVRDGLSPETLIPIITTDAEIEARRRNSDIIVFGLGYTGYLSDMPNESSNL